MQKSVAIIISPNFGDYAEKFLPECIESIRVQDYAGKIKVFITDNESSAESALSLRRLVPEAELVLNVNNDGFAKGCNDSMRLALSQGYEYIFLVSIHSVLMRSCVRELSEAMETDKHIGVAQARMMLFGTDGLVAGLGNETHFLGFGFSSGYKDKWRDQAKGLKDIFYASGGSMFFRREALEAAGLFDEEYWMYNEDQELPWRLRLNGWRVVLVPSAVAVTKYEFKRSIKKVYWMDRNRIISILLCYKFLTLIIIFPAFMLMELGQVFFAWRNDWLKDKFRVWLYFLRPRTWIYVFRARKRNQALRIVPDREIAQLITGRISHQEFTDNKIKMANVFFDIYWRIAKRMIAW